MGGADKVWELITDEDKLRKYTEFVNNLPFYERANYVDPDILWGMRERWLDILKTKGYINLIDADIIRGEENLDKVRQAIREKLEEIEKNKDGWMFAVAKDMYSGEYEVRDRKITTDTEKQLTQAKIDAQEELKRESPAPKPFRGGP